MRSRPDALPRLTLAWLVLLLLVLACRTPPPAVTPEASEMGGTAEVAATEGPGEARAYDHHAHRFTDPERYAKRWNAPERDAWQRPEAVVAAMEIAPGMSVADLGAGTGYFVPHLAVAVGEAGRVFAVDIEIPMLAYIDAMTESEGLTNVETVLATEDESGLEPASVDRILVVNTWHHIPDRADYARHLASRLTGGGSVWIVDYTPESPVGPPAAHRLPAEQVIAELEAGGFVAAVHPLELERQYVVVGARQ